MRGLSSRAEHAAMTILLVVVRLDKPDSDVLFVGWLCLRWIHIRSRSLPSVSRCETVSVLARGWRGVSLNKATDLLGLRDSVLCDESTVPFARRREELGQAGPGRGHERGEGVFEGFVASDYIDGGQSSPMVSRWSVPDTRTGTCLHLRDARTGSITAV